MSPRHRSVCMRSPARPHIITYTRRSHARRRRDNTAVSYRVYGSYQRRPQPPHRHRWPPGVDTTCTLHLSGGAPSVHHNTTDRSIRRVCVVEVVVIIRSVPTSETGLPIPYSIGATYLFDSDFSELSRGWRSIAYLLHDT